MKKRIFSALIAVALVVVMLTVAVSAASFSDVKDGKWYAADVNYVVEKGIMKGTGGNKFNPGGTITRAEFMLIIYNYEVANYGAVENDGAYTYTDITGWLPTVAGNDIALKWAQDAGIVVEEAFRPYDAITRIEMAEMLYNYLENYRDISEFVNCAEVDESLSVVLEFGDLFDDKYANISDNQFNAIQTMGEMALIAGIANPENPDAPLFDGFATSDRAQAAALIARLDRTTSHPSFAAKVAIGEFNREYKDPVHADGVMFAIKSNMSYKFDGIVKAIDKALVYDADKYALEIVEYDFDGNWSNAGGGFSFGPDDNITFALVSKEDPTVKVENYINIFGVKFPAEDDGNYDHIQIMPHKLVVADNVAANAEIIVADATEKLDQLIDYYAGSDGKVYLYVQDGSNIEGDLVFWFGNLATNEALGYGYSMGDEVADDQLVPAEVTAAAQDALVNDGDTYEFKLPIYLSNSACNGNAAYCARKEVTFVAVKDSTSGFRKVIWGFKPGEGKYNAEEIVDFAESHISQYVCADCGVIHMAGNAPADADILKQVAYCLQGQFATTVETDGDFATLADYESKVVTYTLKLSHFGTPDVVGTYSFKVEFYKASFAEAVKLGVCRDTTESDVVEKLDAFVEDYTCPVCGVIHYTLKDNGWRAGRFHDAINSKLPITGDYDMIIYTDPSEIAAGTNVAGYVFPTNDEKNSTTVAELKALLVKGSGYALLDNQQFTQKYLVVYFNKFYPETVTAKFLTVQSATYAGAKDTFGANYVISNSYLTVGDQVFCQYAKARGDMDYLEAVANDPASQAQIAKFQASLDAYVAKFGTAITGAINPVHMQNWANGAGLAWPVFIEPMRAQEGDLKLVDEDIKDGDTVVTPWYARLYNDGNNWSNLIVDGSAWDGTYGALTEGAKIEGTIIFRIQTASANAIHEVSVPVNLTVDTTTAASVAFVPAYAPAA